MSDVVEVIKNPQIWGMYPVLPLTRTFDRCGTQQVQVGFILFPKTRIVVLANVYEFAIALKKNRSLTVKDFFNKSPKHEYQTIEAIKEDGWKIDD